MDKNKKINKEPAYAPGDEKILEESANKEEIKRGKFTKVTELSFDEVDPS